MKSMKALALSLMFAVVLPCIAQGGADRWLGRYLGWGHSTGYHAYNGCHSHSQPYRRYGPVSQPIPHAATYDNSPPASSPRQVPPETLSYPLTQPPTAPKAPQTQTGKDSQLPPPVGQSREKNDPMNNSQEDSQKTTGQPRQSSMIFPFRSARSPGAARPSLFDQIWGR